MILNEIRQLYWGKPFRPFTVNLADGRSIPVSHPEFMALSPSANEIFVYQPTGTFDIVNLALVTSITAQPQNARQRADQSVPSDFSAVCSAASASSPRYFRASRHRSIK